MAENKEKYLIIDNKGMIYEKDKDFPENIVGDLCDIVSKGKSIFDKKDFSINIQYEKANIVLTNKEEINSAICSLIPK